MLYFSSHLKSILYIDTLLWKMNFESGTARQSKAKRSCWRTIFQRRSHQNTRRSSFPVYSQPTLWPWIWKPKRYVATQSLPGLMTQFWLSSPTITGHGTRNARKLTIKSSKRQGKIETRRGPRQKRRQKVSLVKLKRTQKTRDEGLARVAYDVKSVEKFGGIVE